MKVLALSFCLVLVQLRAIHMAAIETFDGETFLHFDFKTENGQQREEDIKYDNKKVATNATEDLKHQSEVSMKPIEYRGAYSFISEDGYEYTVKYKANKNGFQPYVTAHKLKDPPEIV